MTTPPQAFYTVTGEIALARGEPRVAALQYAAAAATETDPALFKRAAEVTAATLQPTLTAAVAARWIHLDPKSLDAQRAAARAALALYAIDESAAHYRFILLNSPAGTDAEFADLEVRFERRRQCVRRAPGRGSIGGVFSSIARLRCGFKGSPRCVRTILPRR